MHAGAPCPEPLKRAVIDAVPDDIVWEFYGSTEARFTVCSPEDWLAHPGSVGRARPGRRLTTSIAVATDTTRSGAAASTTSTLGRYRGDYMRPPRTLVQQTTVINNITNVNE